VVVTTASPWFLLSVALFGTLRISLLEWYGLWGCVWLDIWHSPLVEKSLPSNLQFSNVVLNLGVEFVFWIIQTPKLATQRIDLGLVELFI